MNYEQFAIQLADERRDALLGQQLLRQLEDKWFGEGVAAFQAGRWVSDLWNDVQRGGWLAARLWSGKAVTA